MDEKNAAPSGNGSNNPDSKISNINLYSKSLAVKSQERLIKKVASNKYSTIPYPVPKCDRQEKYFQFPLFMMGTLLTNPQRTLNHILTYGFFRYAFSIQLAMDKVADRVIYVWVNNKLNTKLRRILDEYGNTERLIKQVDYRGFGDIDNKYNPEEQREQLMEIFKENNQLYDQCYEFAQIETALHNLKKFYDCEILDSVHNSVPWYRGLTIPDKEPFPQISIPRLMDFLTNRHSDTDLIELACYIGITSIIGKSKYKRMTKDHILCRMLGYSSPKYKSKKMPEIYHHLMLRRNFDKLKSQLEFKWHLLFFSKFTHGFFVGKQEMTSYEQLADVCEKSKIKNKLIKMQKEKDAAYQKAKAKYTLINGTS